MAITAETQLNAKRTILELKLLTTTLYSLTLERLHAGECMKQSCGSSESVREIATGISDPNLSGLLPVIA